MLYEINNPDCRELISAMALGTKATFSYDPTDEDILQFLGKKDTKKTKDKKHNDIESIPQ